MDARIRGLRVLVSAVSAKSGGSAVYIKNLSRCRRLKESPYEFIFLVPPGLANSLETPAANIRVIATDRKSTRLNSSH